MTLKGKAYTDYMRDYMRRRRAGKKPSSKQDEINRLRAEVSRLTRQPDLAVVKTRAKGRTDWDAARQDEITKLRIELGRERELRAKAEAKLATVPPAERDGELARLKNANRELRFKCNYLRDHFDKETKELKRDIEMPREVFNAVVKCLHSDAGPPTTAERNHAYQLFMDWKNQKVIRSRKVR
jgi:hypothetical protein